MRMQILIVGDHGPTLEKLESRIAIFWPPDIPVKTTAVYCAWADEVIETLTEYWPDILLLNFKFRHDERTGKDVALWIDQNYRQPILVAAYSDNTEEDLRQLFSGAECVKYFIRGDRIKDFIEDCITKDKAE
ncbi:MAG: hypothetical protein HYU27_01205 [Acidobacteria bacterium]|nr:hypothetical protein [Acidobacteriota bacterium]